MLVSMQRLRRARVMKRPEGSQFPWLIIGGAFAVTVAIIVLKESGASDADTDYLSMFILIAALAVASTLDRRTGPVVAILAGVIAAIVPGSTSFTHTRPLDSLFRVCFLVAMSMSFYRVIVALRDREDRLQRQLGNVQRLQEEVTALHALTVRAPIERESVYRQIARAALRLGEGTRSRLMLRDSPDGTWTLASEWPPSLDNSVGQQIAVAAGPTDTCPYSIMSDNGQETITVPFSAGNRVTGALQLVREVGARDSREDAQLLAIYARDATLTIEHIALQQQLEHFAVMGERGRIARELHDGLVQSLAGIAFHLEYYRDALGSEAAIVRAGIEAMAVEVKGALHEARSMIHELRSEPRPENLCAALGDLVDQVAAKTDLPIAADIPDAIPPITRAQAGALLRIAREALQNIVKHAAADRVRLELIVTPDRVILRIVDNGRGFVVLRDDAADPSIHFGLIGMNERAAMHGGAVTIESRPGTGTTVQLAFPVAAAETAA
ncbi:MAG: sensor histidine kinase [Chloroflexota bacterium]|nr:sensor histidine kinase [Chloroflexota bacterium]